MTDAQFVLAALLVAPAVILLVTAMLRGYHVLVKIYRPTDGTEECEHHG